MIDLAMKRVKKLEVPIRNVGMLVNYMGLPFEGQDTEE
jgi:hypothetical protein